MFGRRYWQFDSPFAQRDWEGWTPPWLQPDWSGPRGPRYFGRPPFGPGGQWGSPEQQALMREAAEVAQLFAIAGRRAFSNPETLAELRALLDRTRKELATIIGSSTPSSSTGEASEVGQA